VPALSEGNFHHKFVYWKMFKASCSGSRSLWDTNMTMASDNIDCFERIVVVVRMYLQCKQHFRHIFETHILLYKV